MCRRAVEVYTDPMLTRAGCIFEEKASEVMKSLRTMSRRSSKILGCRSDLKCVSCEVVSFMAL